MVKLWPLNCVHKDVKVTNYLTKGAQGAIYVACLFNKCEYVLKVSKFYDKQDEDQWDNEVFIQKYTNNKIKELEK